MWDRFGWAVAGSGRLACWRRRLRFGCASLEMAAEACGEGFEGFRAGFRAAGVAFCVEG